MFGTLRFAPCRSLAELITHACSSPRLVFFLCLVLRYQVQLDRVLDVDEVEGEETRLLVKWAGAPYSECTYELVKDLEHAGQVGEKKVWTSFTSSSLSRYRGPVAVLRYRDGVLSLSWCVLHFLNSRHGAVRRGGGGARLASALHCRVFPSCALALRDVNFAFVHSFCVDTGTTDLRTASRAKLQQGARHACNVGRLVRGVRDTGSAVTKRLPSCLPGVVLFPPLSAAAGVRRGRGGVPPQRRHEELDEAQGDAEDQRRCPGPGQGPSRLQERGFPPGLPERGGEGSRVSRLLRLGRRGGGGGRGGSYVMVWCLVSVFMVFVEVWRNRCDE